MIKKLLLLFIPLLIAKFVFATGEPSTYFQIYVPPNNDAVKRDAALIVTAIYDSTSFEIIDDGADGDTDDSKTGMLMAGQSYVLYIRDNGINDDARYASGGILKWDGDYFIVKSDKLMFASQSTNSDWQHDWVPSTDKKSIGQKFIIYSPPYTSSKRDVNVFAYDNNTTVIFQKISSVAQTNTGFTTVNLESPTTIFTRTLNIGEDIINMYTDGRDVMEAGETYMIIADKPITVQYGALYTNVRDGGGYVPASNGSSAGSLLYFAVPYDYVGEQEIRIVSWDDANAVKLERFSNGSWIEMKSFALNKMQPADWVGRSNGNVAYPTTFRVTCSSGKRVSVFEGNWFETGSPGTSDMATMVSSENGTSAGLKFVTYMAPPGSEYNAVNPFTGLAFGQQLTHLFIFAKDSATVTVKDSYSNGKKFNKTYNIGAQKYIDCYLTLTEWQNIYNGTGTNSGPERPYLTVESNSPVSVMNSNFQDNWMCYSGSSLTQSFTETSVVSQSNAIPTDTVTVTSIISTSSQVDKPKIEVTVEDGLKVLNSKVTTPASVKYTGSIDVQPNKTVVSFNNIPSLSVQSQYTVETKVVASAASNTGAIITAPTNATVETVVTGTIGGQIQQSSSTQVVNVNTTNTSKLIFGKYTDNLVTKDSTDSWTASWVDVNNDGYDDLFVTDKRSNKPNLLYINNKAGGFTKHAGLNWNRDSSISVANTWADVDNDGDIDALITTNTLKPNVFYRNDGNGNFTKDNTQPFTQSVSYYDGAAFADYDNDGKVDLFLCNYFPTRYNELYRNNGAGSFIKEQVNVIPTEANQSIGPTWADYDGDGFVDLFVPNGSGYNNSLFHNEGNGTFRKVQNIVTSEGGNSVGSCWGDYDGDGDLDLFVSNANGLGNFLYRNDGKGNFTKITTGIVVTDKKPSHGCSFADIDNDGDLDLYVTSDKNLKLLYINNGNGTFTKKEDELITFNFGNSYAHIWSDFDHDGDLDLFVPTHSNQPNAFFINNGNSNSWVEVKLSGTVSNKSAIGADVFVYANGKLQVREVNSQSGFGGMSSLTQHFGLGNATIIDSIKIKWPSGVVQYLNNVAVKQILNITETPSVKVNGGVYFDANNNCQKDIGEEMVARAPVNLISGNTKLYSNDNGFFSINLAAGSYQLIVANEKGVTAACTKPVDVNITDVRINIDTVWLPATAVCNSSDVNLLMGGTAIRKGNSTNKFTIIVSNNGRQAAVSPVLKFKAPATDIIGTPSLPFSNITTMVENNVAKKLYAWNLSSLPPFKSQVITFTHGTDATVNIGDSVVLNGWIEGINNDCNTADNSVDQVYKVVGAIDPNDLQVAPVGYGKEGYIQPTQPLTYTIRFKNTGNHPATRVNITDELPEGLDLTSLKVIAASHDNLSTQLKGNTVSFIFDNIYLSDSLTDAEGSNGYISFSIHPKPGIAAGTRLLNKATIQFEHYEPVTTNDVLNTIQSRIQEEQMIEVRSFPNPAADVVYVSLKHKMGKFTNKRVTHVELFDLMGRLILAKDFGRNDDLRFDIPLIVNGTYILKVRDNENQTYDHKILLMRQK